MSTSAFNPFGAFPSRVSAEWRGFTLVEMLLVVAVIVLLIAMLLPSLQGGREMARRAKCLTQQHAIATGAIQYAGGNGGKLPVMHSWATHFITGTPEAYIDNRELLLSLSGSPETYYCPSHTQLKRDNPSVGWNGSAQDRFMSYGPIGIWQQSSSVVSWPKTYTSITPFTKPTVAHQGNRPTRLASASGSLAVTTDAQISWYAGAWGLSFTYPGDGVWPENPGYYAYYAYPHRNGFNAWAGSNAVFFDGSGRWGNFDQIVEKAAPYPHGAKWVMHYQRGIYEGLVFW